MWARVLQPHLPLDTSNQLTLLQGDVVRVLQRDESGWWAGHKEGSPITGWFPSGIVQTLAQRQAAPEKAGPTYQQWAQPAEPAEPASTQGPLPMGNAQVQQQRSPTQAQQQGSQQSNLTQQQVQADFRPTWCDPSRCCNSARSSLTPDDTSSSSRAGSARTPVTTGLELGPRDERLASSTSRSSKATGSGMTIAEELSSQKLTSPSEAWRNVAGPSSWSPAAIKTQDGRKIATPMHSPNSSRKQTSSPGTTRLAPWNSRLAGVSPRDWHGASTFREKSGTSGTSRTSRRLTTPVDRREGQRANSMGGRDGLKATVGQTSTPLRQSRSTAVARASSPNARHSARSPSPSEQTGTSRPSTARKATSPHGRQASTGKVGGSQVSCRQSSASTSTGGSSTTTSISSGSSGTATASRRGMERPRSPEVSIRDLQEVRELSLRLEKGQSQLAQRTEALEESMQTMNLNRNIKLEELEQRFLELQSELQGWKECPEGRQFLQKELDALRKGMVEAKLQTDLQLKDLDGLRRTVAEDRADLDSLRRSVTEDRGDLDALQRSVTDDRAQTDARLRALETASRSGSVTPRTSSAPAEQPDTPTLPCVKQMVAVYEQRTAATTVQSPGRSAQSPPPQQRWAGNAARTPQPLVASRVASFQP